MDFFSIQKEGPIGILRLNRPPANAISTAVLEELSEAIDTVNADDSLKAIILHGEGRFFAAGADIKEFLEVKDGQEFSRMAHTGQTLFKRIEGMKKPVIAAIHGAALGGGLELAMACHLRVAAKDAKLGLPELTLGIIPGFAGSQRLPDLVGKAKAAEMMLSGEPMTGEEAEKIGLVNIACEAEDVFSTAMRLAEKVVEKSKVTIEMVMELLTYSERPTFQDGSKKEAELFGKAYDSHDGKEGIQAFIEKRKPNFQDK